MPLVRNTGVRAISFTGSVPVGKGARDEATARDCQVQLELDGHNPLIIMRGAELGNSPEPGFSQTPAGGR